jgi:deferrochelatase/peroxidase EfeB
MNAGLLFICYNRNTQNQFELIQKRLSNPNLPDKLLSYTQMVAAIMLRYLA